MGNKYLLPILCNPAVQVEMLTYALKQVIYKCIDHTNKVTGVKINPPMEFIISTSQSDTKLLQPLSANTPFSKMQ